MDGCVSLSVSFFFSFFCLVPSEKTADFFLQFTVMISAEGYWGRLELVGVQGCIYSPSGLFLSKHTLVYLRAPLAGCFISHDRLPEAVQGNECKMLSCLKMGINAEVLGWAPLWPHATSFLLAAWSHQFIGLATVSLNYTQLKLCLIWDVLSADLAEHPRTKRLRLIDCLLNPYYRSF